MTLFGLDLSDFNPALNWPKVAADGISFVTHKASEGTSNQHHPAAALNGARAAGIPFLGAYMIPRSGPSVSAQVDYFLSWVDHEVPWWRTFGGWFWQVDTEHWSYDAVSPAIGQQACALLAQRTGKRVIHYAPQWAYGNGVPGAEPLWASSYVGGNGWYHGLYPGDNAPGWHAYSGRTPAILQFSSTAAAGGTPNLDVNAFRGTAADFAALIGQPHTGGADVALTPEELAILKDIQRVANNADIALWQALRGEPAIKFTRAPDGSVGQPYVNALGADIAAIKAAVQAPAALTVTDAQLTAIVSQVSAALVAAPDNPLSPANLAAIEAVVEAALGKLRLTVTP